MPGCESLLCSRSSALVGFRERQQHVHEVEQHQIGYDIELNQCAPAIAALRSIWS